MAGLSILGRRPRRLLLALLVGGVVFFTVLLSRGTPPSTTPHAAGARRDSSGPVIREHPIPRLMEDARRKWDEKVKRQSRTLGQAVKEYKQRYGRRPPRGFDKWFAFAQSKGFEMIDEFDGLDEDIYPFFRLPPLEVRRRTAQVGRLVSMDLVRFERGRAVVVTREKDGLVDASRAYGLIEMMENSGVLSEMPEGIEWAVNGLAEGRVFVPWEWSQSDNRTRSSAKGIESAIGQPFLPTWRAQSSVWEQYRHVHPNTCHPATPARQDSSVFEFPDKTAILPPFIPPPVDGPSDSDPGPTFAFLEDTQHRLDFCNDPYRFFEFGHFYSDWRTIKALYPVFSPGKAPGSADIRIPSSYYYRPSGHYTYGYKSTYNQVFDNDDQDPPWERKFTKIFWRGATTGGGSTPPARYSHYQRHRLVQQANQPNPHALPVVYPTSPPPPAENAGWWARWRDAGASYGLATIAIDKLNAAQMDVAFTNVVACEPYLNGGCPGMRQDYRLEKPVALSEAYKYKLLIDVDGMGNSARFLGFQASRSAVVKATVYSEFFTDWIQPWLHFIPLSYTYAELYHIYAFFFGLSPQTLDPSVAPRYRYEPGTHDERGDRLLKSIADEGRKWKQNYARTVDMEVYTYRLCLEWARLWADDRQAWDYV